MDGFQHVIAPVFCSCPAAPNSSESDGEGVRRYRGWTFGEAGRSGQGVFQRLHVVHDHITAADRDQPRSRHSASWRLTLSRVTPSSSARPCWERPCSIRTPPVGSEFALASP